MKARAKHKRLQKRIAAWNSPQSAGFRQQIAQGGAKCPGSRKR